MRVTRYWGALIEVQKKYTGEQLSENSIDKNIISITMRNGNSNILGLEIYFLY